LIVPPTESARLAEALQRVGRGERTAGWDAEWTARGGINLPVSTAISPVHDRHGSVVAASSITRDVTEQRWMAETLDRTLAALQEALAEARASEETTRRFLADAAHQLRTPMAGIRACAETLLRGADPDDADRLLATMVRETSRAARLITSLLRIARLEQGVLGAPIVPVDVVPLCAAEVERLTLLSPDLEVRLVIEQAPTGPVQLDAAATQEILSNLGDNARRHAASRIQLVVDADDECVRLRMVDDGPGVPAELREEVFERFVSLDGRGGSGLGLPIARGLARAMDGDLRYEGGFLLELAVQDVTISALSST
jgi:signal transduction histidine kinase